MLPSIIFQEYLKEHLSTHHLQTAKPSPQDDSSILHLSPTQIVALRLSPKLFGHPNSRDRAWRILFRKGVKKWSCNHTFQELADIILMDKKDDLLLDYGCYLFETKMGPEYGTITEDELARRSCMIMIFFQNEKLKTTMLSVLCSHLIPEEYHIYQYFPFCSHIL